MPCVQIDEMWTWVGNKKQKQWLWYVWDNYAKSVLCWHIGGRSYKDLVILINLLESLDIGYYCTDAYKIYKKYFKHNKNHIVSKKYTQDIERNNLNFRTHIKRLNRRTICFSRNFIIHRNVIGLYIQERYYNPITYVKRYFNSA